MNDYELMKLPISTIFSLLIQYSFIVLSNMYYLFCFIKAVNDHLREFGKEKINYLACRFSH